MNFTKYFIAGKDYVQLSDCKDILSADDEGLLTLCDRLRGVGADGIFTFQQKSDKITQINGLLNNGQIMRDFSSASICACFDTFSESHAASIAFSSENEVISEVKCDFTDNIARIFYSIPTSADSADYCFINRRTEIGNRILTVTRISFSGLHGIHFSDCKDKLDLNYLGRHFSRNSLFNKKGNLILAQKTRSDTYEIDFYENGTGNPRPAISSFIATALAAIKSGQQKFNDKIHVVNTGSCVDIICHDESCVDIFCEIRKVLSGSI